MCSRCDGTLFGGFISRVTFYDKVTFDPTQRERRVSLTITAHVRYVDTQYIDMSYVDYLAHNFRRHECVTINRSGIIGIDDDVYIDALIRAAH